MNVNHKALIQQQMSAFPKLITKLHCLIFKKEYLNNAYHCTGQKTLCKCLYISPLNCSPYTKKQTYGTLHSLKIHVFIRKHVYALFITSSLRDEIGFRSWSRSVPNEDSIILSRVLFNGLNKECILFVVLRVFKVLISKRNTSAVSNIWFTVHIWMNA